MKQVEQVDLSKTFTPVISGAQTATEEINGLAQAAASVPANFGQDLGAGLSSATDDTAALAEATGSLGDTLGTSATAAGTLLQASERAAAAERRLAGDTAVGAAETRQAILAEEGLANVRIRARRGFGVGPLRFAGIGVGVGVGIFAATQALGDLSAALRVTGDDAATTQGKLRNVGASILSGDILGAFRSLTAQAQGLTAAEKELVALTPSLQRSLSDMTAAHAAVFTAGGLPPQAAAGLSTSGSAGRELHKFLEGQRKDLAELGKVSAQTTESLTQAELDNDSVAQIAILKKMDAETKAAIAAARGLVVTEDERAKKLTELLKQRITIRGQIEALSGKKGDILAPMLEAVTDAQLGGNAAAIIAVLAKEKFLLENVLIPFAASADTRRKFKDDLKTVNKDLEQTQQGIVDEEKRHREAMRDAQLLPAEAAISAAEASGSESAQLDTLRQEKAILERRLDSKKETLAESKDDNNRLAAINSQIEGIEQARADREKQHAEEMKQKAAAAHQAILDSFGLREQATEIAQERAALAGSVAGQRKALKDRIAVLREETRTLTGGELQQAQLALIAALNAQAQFEKDIRDARRQAVRDQISTQEDRLQDQVTLAGFTEKTTKDDESALKKLIAFEKKQAHNRKLTLDERRKHLIAERQAEKDLRDLNKQDDGASFQKLSFEFLQRQQGFASTLASNLLPPSAGLGVGGSTTPRPSPFAPPATTAPEVDLRNAGGRGITSGQGETLIHLQRRTVTVLGLLAAGLGHPEALQTRRTQNAVMETTAHA